MKKIVILIAVLAIAPTLLLTGCTTTPVNAYDEQVLTFSSATKNFNYTGENEDVKTDWTFEAGNGASTSSVFSTSANGLKINTQNAGYAVASQKVYLKRYAYYKVTYVYDMDSVAEFSTEDEYTRWVGMYLGFKEDPSFNTGDKNSEVRHVTSTYKTDTFYFKTDGTKEYNFAIFVGSETEPVSAVVYLKDIQLTRVTEAEVSENAEAYGFYELKSQVYGQATTLNIAYVIIGAIATLILAYVAYAIRSRSLAFEGLEKVNNFFDTLKNSKWLGLVISLAIAAVIRLAIMLTETIIAGSDSISSSFFGYDLEENATIAGWLAKYSAPYLYEYNTTYTTLMPVSLYLSAIAGLISRAFFAMGAEANVVSLTAIAMIKIIGIIADLGAIALIYCIIAKKQGRVGATIMASFYSLIPMVFAMSSAWGSYESVTAFLLVLAVWFLLNKGSYLGMAISYFFACMTSVSAIYVCPAVLLYTGYVIYRAIKDKQYVKLIAPIATIVGSLVVFYLISLPFVFNEVAGGDAFVAFTRYIDTLKGQSVYTANAFNFQGLLGNNFKVVGVQSIFVTILYIAFIVVLLGVAYYRSRNRIDLTLIAATCVIAFWTFANNMSYYSLYVSLPLLFIVSAMIKDARLYVAFVIYAVLAYVNAAYVYLVAGYTTSGVVAVSNEVTAIVYVMGSLSLVAAVYYVVVVYDILINKKAVEQTAISVPYFEYVKYTALKVIAKLKVGVSKTGAFFQATGEAIKEVSAERKLKRAARKEESDEENI